MTNRIARLTDRELDVLRLLARGHDAKSAARTLGLSVHSINERLRDARRTLEVSSSRAAARLLLEAESAGGPEIWDKEMGLGTATPVMVLTAAPDRLSGTGKAVLILAGVLVMAILLLAIALLSSGRAVVDTPASPSAAPKWLPPRPRKGA